MRRKNRIKRGITSFLVFLFLPLFLPFSASFYASTVKNTVTLMQHFIYYAADISITQYYIVNYSLFRF